MTSELQALIDARSILVNAWGATSALGPIHSKLSRAVEYLDKQIEPLVHAAIDEELASA